SRSRGVSRSSHADAHARPVAAGLHRNLQQRTARLQVGTVYDRRGHVVLQQAGSERCGTHSAAAIPAGVRLSYARRRLGGASVFPRNWSHAAAISFPFERLTVTRTPFFTSVFTNRSIAASCGRFIHA